MKIFVMGAGHMGAWLIEELCLDHEVAVYDRDRRKMKHFLSVKRMLDLSEIGIFDPEIMVNAVSLSNTQKAFEEVLPHLGPDCLLCDLASVKTGLPELYRKMGRKFVSIHPMFGPTFANVRDLRDENIIVIRESDPQGKNFFQKFFQDRQVHIHEYSFKEHDQTIAYSLSIPFASTLVFAACMKKQEAPGTTFRRHLEIARGLLAEDDHLLAEILFNPNTIRQIEEINSKLAFLTHIIRAQDHEEMQRFLNRLRKNIT